MLLETIVLASCCGLFYPAGEISTYCNISDNTLGSTRFTYSLVNLNGSDKKLFIQRYDIKEERRQKRLAALSRPPKAKLILEFGLLKLKGQLLLKIQSKRQDIFFNTIKQAIALLSNDIEELSLQSPLEMEWIEDDQFNHPFTDYLCSRYKAYLCYNHRT